MAPPGWQSPPPAADIAPARIPGAVVAQDSPPLLRDSIPLPLETIPIPALFRVSARRRPLAGLEIFQEGLLDLLLEVRGVVILLFSARGG